MMKLNPLSLCLLALFLSLRTAHGFTGDRPSLILDNTDRAFQSSPRSFWISSVRDKGYFGENYIWCEAGEGEARATWSFNLPHDGVWNVYARWVMSRPSDRATDAPFTVVAADTSRTVRVNMALPQSAAQYPAGRPQSAWNLLGSFNFNRQALVVLTNDADNSVVADAVRLEFMAPSGAPEPVKGELILSDDFSGPDNWSFEGNGEAVAVDSLMTLISHGESGGITAWLLPLITDSVIVEYEMRLRPRPGNAELLFSAQSPDGRDILSALPERDGLDEDYFRNPRLEGYHVSIHRSDRTGPLGGANLSRIPGPALLQRNAVDPCPPSDSARACSVRLLKMGPLIELRVDGERALYYLDDIGEMSEDGPDNRFRETAPPIREGFRGLSRPARLFEQTGQKSRSHLGGGRLAFRHTFHGSADYARLRVYRAVMP